MPHPSQGEVINGWAQFKLHVDLFIRLDGSGFDAGRVLAGLG
jgi:hypothetical protein